MISFLRRGHSFFVPMLWLVVTTGVGSIPSFAQEDKAQVYGRVQDASGAAIAGAQVKITQTATQQERQIISDAGGGYVAPQLPVGPYQVEVTVSGFKTYLQSGILLQVGDNIEINVAMQVGATSEQIEVTAQASMVETRDNTVSEVIDEKRIVELPLNGRQTTQLVLLTPGALTPPGTTGGGDEISTKTLYNSVVITVAGMQGNGVAYLLDGADNNDASSNVNLPFPFPDALQEFSVQTAGLPARYGYHPSAVVNAITKSGTNEWHGDFFEFLRNGDVNARSFFAPVHDNLKRNQFGGTVGGRVIKDKLFFFAGFQATYNRQSANTTAFVPTAAALTGDFSVLDGPQCVAGGKTINNVNPSTGAVFPGNKIPVSLFDPASINLSKLLPAAQNQCGMVNFPIATTGDDDQGIIRADWLVNPKHTIFARSFTGNYRNPEIVAPNNILTSANIGLLQGWEEATIGDTYTLSPSVLNAFHISFTRRTDLRIPADGLPTPHSLGVNDNSPIPNEFYASVSSYFSAGCSACTAAQFNINSFHYGDDVDIIKGKHQIGFGVNFSRNQFNGFQSLTANGLFTFTGQYATGKSVGDPLAAYFLGAMSGFSQSSQTTDQARQWVFGMYFQDTIKLTPRLTVNVGLRWDPGFGISEPKGAEFSQAAFNAGQHSTVYPTAPAGILYAGDPGVPDGFQQVPKALFSPRLGIAWDPTGSGKQSIRIGSAILRNTEDLWYALDLPQDAPFGTSLATTATFLQGSTFSNPWGGYPGGDPFPLPNPLPKNFAFPLGAQYKTMPLIQQPMYVAQWNASYQRQITSSWLATVSYIGSKTTHVWAAGNYNPGVYLGNSANISVRRVLYLENPAQGAYYGSGNVPDTGANSNYNGLLLSLQHRFSHNFTWLSNYTWSHCLGSADNSTVITSPDYEQINNRQADYGNCYFDIRHNFNTSLVVISPSVGPALVSHIIGNWQLAPLVTLQTGTPINVLDGTDVSQTGINLDRPNYVSGCNPYLHDGNPIDYLNRACFQVEAPGTYGSLGRNVLFGPGAIRVDVALTRTFHITERWLLTPRFEAFNAINHPNFGPPTLTLNSPTFGVVTNVVTGLGGQTFGSTGDPRILQFAMKLQF